MDELLPLIGEFGRYQKLLVWLICLPACIPCGFCAFNQLFMTDVPADFWCFIPELANLSMEERLELGIPYEEVVVKGLFEGAIKIPIVLFLEPPWWEI